MNNKTLTVSLLVVGLFIAALMARSGALAWLALPFLFYLGAGVLRSPARESVRLEAQREVRHTRFANSGPEEAALLEVRLTVRNLGEPLDRVVVRDPLPEGLAIHDGQAERETSLGSGEEVSLTYACRERRGSYAWSTTRVLVSDALGLVETEYELPARGEIQVQPERAALRRLPLRPRSTVHAPGSIPARLGGSGTDFWGVREYQPGDPLRWLDWRLTARHPRKYFTKEFEQEEIADIGLLLDARQKTDLRRADDSLFERSVDAAAALAEAFLHQGHRVSLLAFGSKVEPVFAGYGKVQLSKIMRCLSNVQPGSSNLWNYTDYLPLRMFSSRALLIVISPLVRSDWPFFLRLRASGYQGLLISPNPFDFVASPPAGGAGKTDGNAEARLALRAAGLERALLMRDIAQLQIQVIDWHVSQPLYPLVRDALSPAHFRRGARQLNGEAL